MPCVLQLRFVSRGAAEFLSAVDRFGRPLAAATAGLSMFHDGRRPADLCRHRPRMEGLQALLPYLLPAAELSTMPVENGSGIFEGKGSKATGAILPGSLETLSCGRRVEVGTAFLLSILESGRMRLEDCPRPLQALSPGACVVTAALMSGSKSAGSVAAAAVAWKGESGTVQLHADAMARRALLTLLI
jgi:hypothetical protein